MGTLLLSGWSVALAQTDSTTTEKGATLAPAPVAVSAPTETVSKAKEEPKLSVKPTGRILFDAALFAPKNQKDLFNDGFGVPDVRVGVAAKYDKWYAKVDIGYAYGKVGLKDILLQYTFNEHQLLRRRLLCASIRFTKCYKFIFQNLYGRAYEPRNIRRSSSIGFDVCSQPR